MQVFVLSLSLSLARSVSCIECCCVCHQGQICKKAESCVNLYPCVIKYYLMSLSVSPSVCLSVRLFVCLSLCLSVFVNLSVCLCLSLSVSLCLHLSVCLSVCLNITLLQLSLWVATLVTSNLVPVLSLFGVVGNALNVAVFFRQGLRERVNVCLFSLALADLTVSTLYFLL